MRNYKKTIEELEKELKTLEENLKKAELEKVSKEEYCGLIKETCIETSKENEKELERLGEFKEKRTEKEENLKKSRKTLFLSRIVLILSILFVISGFICISLAAVQIGMGIIMAVGVSGTLYLELIYKYEEKNRELSRFTDLFKLSPEEINKKIDELKLVKSETKKAMENIEGILEEINQEVEEAKRKIEDQKQKITKFKAAIEEVIAEFVPSRFSPELKEVFERYIDRAYRLTLDQE